MAFRARLCPDTPLNRMDTTNSQSSTAAAASAADVSDGSGRSTNFLFENKVFSVEHGFFSMTRDTKEPVLNVMLGELQATLPLASLRSEFNIAPESSDGRLLNLIEASLRFVKEIRPNDSVPRELLDGSASWTVEARHREIAQSRLALQICSWASGAETVISDAAQLVQLADDPATKQRVQAGVGEIAERLGIGRERKQQVVDKLEQFGRELAYVEALRERSGCVKFINDRLNRFSKIYRHEKSVSEDIVRVLQLLRAPIAEFDATFDLIDAQTGEVLNLIQTFDAQLEFVRESRDDLHCRLMMWDDLIAKWQALEMARSPAAVSLIKETYRFTAHNFPQMKSWLG